MDRNFLIDLFAPFGAIDIKRMFSGFALSADELTFSLVLRGRIYLKADAETIPRFEAEGCTPFSYEAKGRPVTITSYWLMPERLYDDPDELVQWARLALEAARRAALKKAKPRKKASKTASSKRRQS